MSNDFNFLMHPGLQIHLNFFTMFIHSYDVLELLQLPFINPWTYLLKLWLVRYE